MNRNDFMVLAETRLREAKLLLDGREFSGSYHLAGLAVECALKACIAKKTREFDFPDKDFASKCYTHKPEPLLTTAGLDQELKKATPGLMLNWTLVKDWSEQTRYQTKNEQEAVDLYNAISDLNEGVLPWIRRFW